MIRRTLRQGFTLLEMMVVIVIIGILSTYLVVNAPQWFDRANATASERNMGRLYQFLLDYQQNNNMNWPTDSGQRFFMRPWKDGLIEKTEQQALAFFSPAYTYKDCAQDNGVDPEAVTIVEYVDNWDAIGPGYTSYAGFNASQDKDARLRLKRSPGSVAIVSDAFMIHRFGMIYMTADSATHRLQRTEIEEVTGLDLNDETVVFRSGPGCGVKELEVVSND
jgi:prepilin-type N-terminal cleavage/methylation domain-containing protein